MPAIPEMIFGLSRKHSIVDLPFGKPRHPTGGACSMTLAAILRMAFILGSLLFMDSRAKSAPMGILAWERCSVTVESLSSLGIGIDGKVYVTGSLGDDNMVTKAYDVQGGEVWSRAYDGTGHGPDYGVALAIGPDGTVYTTGPSAGTLGLPNAYASLDIVTIAYSSEGMPLWTNRYNSPENYGEISCSIAVNADGQVFVAGKSETGPLGTAFGGVVLSYSGSGVPLWTNRFDHPADAYAIAVAADHSDRVFVLQGVAGQGSDRYFETVCFSSTGLTLWSQPYAEPGNIVDSNGIAIGADGAVYVSGNSGGNAPDYFESSVVICYSNTGVLRWRKRLVGQSSAINVDSQGHVYLAGNYPFNGTNHYFGNTGWQVIALSAASGQILWTNQVDIPYATANAVTSDPYGNAIAVGWIATIPALFAAAYTASGQVLWTNLIPNQGSPISAVVADARGNAFVDSGCLIRFSPLLFIETQPQSSLVPYGSNALFSTKINGVEPLGYEWYFNGAMLPGETNNALLLYDVTQGSDGIYQLVVTNVYGGVTSAAVRLTVVFPPTIITAPINADVTCGSTAEFTVQATGRSPLVYDWRFDGTTIITTTNAILTLNVVDSSNAGQYDVVVSNFGGSVTSSVATLTVNVDSPPAIFSQPQNGLATVNGRFRFDVAAKSCLSPTYQWYFDGTPRFGANSSGLAFNAVSLSDAGDYWVTICNQAGCVTSAVARLIVNRPPIAQADGGLTLRNQPFVITTAQLLANDSDPDGDPLTLSGVSATSFFGSSVTRDDSMITYAPLAGLYGPDRFSYTVKDGRGGYSTAFVEMFVLDGPALSQDRISIQVIPGGVRFRFLAIPGEQYRFQRSANLEPAAWEDAKATIAPPHGVIEYTETPDSPTAFVRIV